MDNTVTHYFVSWYSFNNKGQKIGYGSSLCPFSDSKKCSSLEKDVFAHCLALAKEYNSDAVDTHVVAFNKV